MRKFLCFAVLLFVCGLRAVAQDNPKSEFFAGYSYLHVGSPGGTASSIPAGFNMDFTWYFLRVLGVTADFEYHHKNDYGPGQSATVLGVVGGPRAKARFGRLEPFAHALFGTTRVSLSYISIPTDNDFAFSTKLGGGLDVAVGRRLAVRVGEFNYYHTNFSGGAGFSNIGAPESGAGYHQNNFTFSAGIVLRSHTCHLIHKCSW